MGRVQGLLSKDDPRSSGVYISSGVLPYTVEVVG